MPGNQCYISHDVKYIVVRMHEEDALPAEIRRFTGVAESSQRHILRLYRETGDVEQIPVEHGRKRVLSGVDVAFLAACIERCPDSTLKELQLLLEETCNVYVNYSTILQTLRRHRFTRKKVQRPALERNEERRTDYRLRIGTLYEAEQLVFVDESHLNRFSARHDYGWALNGHRVSKRDFFVCRQRYSMLPALSLDGIIYLDVFPNAITAVKFSAFIEGLLDQMNPFPQRNSVVVMDNAWIHKSEGLHDMIEAHGMRLEYLPPYSPDLNPIEEAFSCIKAWVCSNRSYVLGELSGEDVSDPYTMSWEAVFNVMPEKAEGWFRHSGYI